MKPLERLNAAAITATTAVIVWLLKQAADYQASYAFFNKISVRVLVFAFITGTLYTQLLKILVWAGKKIGPLKKLLLGKDYMHGTWAGFYIGAGNKERFYIERYDQELDSLTIHGHSLDEAGQTHSDWQSESYNINSEGRNISYMYEVTAYKDNRNNKGMAFFIFDQGKKTPSSMHGFSTDEHLGVRTIGMEIKLGSSLTISEEDGWNAARELFAEHGHRYLPTAGEETDESL